MARPTILTDELIEKAEGYIDYRLEQKLLPTIEGLAVYLGINRDTVYDWKNKHERFSDIYEDIMATQGDQLVNKGLSGEYNSTIAKLILTKHDYSDKQDITSGGDKLPTPILQPLRGIEEDGEQ